MNSLSWFLYFADVLSALKEFLIVSSTIGIMVLVLALIFFDSRYPKTIAAILFVFFLVCLIPSKNTMYAIAASEVGEAALQSKIGEKSMKALELWIDSQIEKKVK